MKGNRTQHVAVIDMPIFSYEMTNPRPTFSVSENASLVPYSVPSYSVIRTRQLSKTKLLLVVRLSQTMRCLIERDVALCLR